MPMIDVYAAEGTFQDPHQLASAGTLMTIEGVPDIPMFRQNTAGFVHEMDGPAISNVNGDSGYVRVQVLTNAGALDRTSSWPWSASSPIWWPRRPETPPSRRGPGSS
jgi:hypothetical protein